MRALVCESAGVLQLREVPEPSPAAGEVVVHVGAALTCGTDLKMIQRGHPKIPFPVVVGHEFAGTVHRVGEGVRFEPGELVTSAVSGPCEHCADCIAGRQNLCRTAFDRPLWGAFAEYVRVPDRVVRRGLRRIPATLPLPAAALLDPLASVVHGLSRLSFPPDATVLLYGCGPIALLFAHLIRRSRAARVLAAGRRPSRLAALASHGAEVIDRTSVSVRAAVNDATRGRGADFVIDTTGDANATVDLLPLVARGGSLLLFAGAASGVRVGVDAGRIHYDEVSLIGSFHYTPAEADEALSLLMGDAVPVDAVITATRPLSDFAAVFERARRGEGMKTALIP